MTMTMTMTININLDKKCAECGKGGATGSGLCMGCIAKAFDSVAKMKSGPGKAAQNALKQVRPLTLEKKL